MMQKGVPDAVENGVEKGLGLYERPFGPRALADLFLKFCIAVLERFAHDIEMRGELAELGLVLVVYGVPQVASCYHPRGIDQRIDGPGDGPGQAHGDDDAEDKSQKHSCHKDHPCPLHLLHRILRHGFKPGTRLYGHVLGLNEKLISDGRRFEFHFIDLPGIGRGGDVVA